MNRRNFFQKSLLATGGLILAPVYISCNNDDVAPIDLPDLNRENFLEGVASFDPTSTSVVIWTRFTPSDTVTGQVIDIQWQVAKDENFTEIVRSGNFSTDLSRDYTVAIDVRDLSSDSKFYYRFIELTTATVSVTGETITLPDAGMNPDQVKLAVCSCANYAAGLFNVYYAIANSDVDVVVHLGDYIYEYGEGEYGTNENTVSLGRVHEPANEILSLEDYRTRYKQYRRDPKLQLAHQKKPFICVWDDHEITNDAYKDGAENHDSSEGSYELRKQIAIQVYSEFLPLRSNDPEKIYRSFDFGSLLSLHMLDTRIIGRDKQMEFATYLDSTGQLDAVAFQQALLDPDRKLLGTEQISWLTSNISSSNAQWQVLGQQVLMGKMFIPAELLLRLGAILAEVGATGSVSSQTAQTFQTTLTELSQIKVRVMQNDPTLTTEEIARVQTTVPYNLDAWDGYFAERELLYASLSGKKVICLAGDTHNAWFSKLVDANNNEVGAEFATSSVTSPGLEVYVGLTAEILAGFEQALELLIDDLDFVDASKRGYLTVSFTSGSVEGQWKFIDTIAQDTFTEIIDQTISYN